MKNRMLQIAVALGLIAATGVVQARGLPEFMNAQQLTVWRAQHAAPVVAATQAPDEQTQFFTGKPYDAASGAYLFKYRAYSPDLARWTSADPGGFPDGANNQVYAPVPTRACDPLGLKGKSVLWAYTYSGEAKDASCAAGIMTAMAQLEVAMQKEDLSSNPKTHYLDDDDKIVYETFYIGEGKTLIKNSPEDKVFLVAQGEEKDGKLTGKWYIGGVVCPANVFANTKVTVWGCNPVDGILKTTQIAQKMADPTKKYLKDSKE